MTVIQSMYFDTRGPDCTEETRARERAETLGIRDVVVATPRGITGDHAAQAFICKPRLTRKQET